jgi:hypothetical protein
MAVPQHLFIATLSLMRDRSLLVRCCKFCCTASSSRRESPQTIPQLEKDTPRAAIYATFPRRGSLLLS